VEAYVYPKRNPRRDRLLPDAEKAKSDKIIIFEDTKGTGKFDKRTVFMEGLNLVSGIESRLRWGVGVRPRTSCSSATTRRPTSRRGAEDLLDGWGYQDTHETLNSFIWGQTAGSTAATVCSRTQR